MRVTPLVINGLHRSGTTMTERLLDSQSDITCFSLYFQIIRAIAFSRGFGDKAEIMTENFNQGKNKICKENDFSIRSHMLMDHIQRVYSPYLADPIQANQNDSLFGLDRITILKFADLISDHRDLSDVGSLLQKIGKQIGTPICATRWTAHHRYAPIFLENPNAFWIEIIRNPYARITSERISHAGSFPVVMKQQQDNFDFIVNFKHPRFKILKYEELCNNTDQALTNLSNWLGTKIVNTELRSVTGSSFRPNTSDNRREGRHIYDNNDSLPAMIGAMDQNRWRENTSQLDIALINKALNFHGLYDKEKTSIIHDLAGGFLWRKISIVQKLKKYCKKIFAQFGFAIKRVT